jgi:sulfide:quinone oxidoreductase
MAAGPHIVILGAGFAALAAARALRGLDRHARIRLVAPRSEFVYSPSLIWVPIGLRNADDLVVPLGAFLANHALDFTRATVRGLAERGRVVLTTSGPIRNDALIIATGARFPHTIVGSEHVATLCEGARATLAIRQRLIALEAGRIAIGCGANPLEPGAVRPGPMFELIFGIDTWLRRRKRRQRFALTFFSDQPQPALRLGASVATRIAAELERRAIDLHTGMRIDGFSGAGVQLDGVPLAADLVVYTPAMAGPSWAAAAALPLSPGGFVAADECCAVGDLEHVYVAGDAGSFPGPAWSPKLAYMAQIQACVAAANLHAALHGETPPARLRHEMLYVLDTLDAGMLVHRTDAHAVALPPALPLHWAKRAVERRFLATLRPAAA